MLKELIMFLRELSYGINLRMRCAILYVNSLRQNLSIQYTVFAIESSLCQPFNHVNTQTPLSELGIGEEFNLFFTKAELITDLLSSTGPAQSVLGNLEECLLAV